MSLKPCRPNKRIFCPCDDLQRNCCWRQKQTRLFWKEIKVSQRCRPAFNTVLRHFFRYLLIKLFIRYRSIRLSQSPVQLKTLRLSLSLSLLPDQWWVQGVSEMLIVKNAHFCQFPILQVQTQQLSFSSQTVLFSVFLFPTIAGISCCTNLEVPDYSRLHITNL